MTRFILMIVAIAITSCGEPTEEKKEAAEQEAQSMPIQKIT